MNNLARPRLLLIALTGALLLLAAACDSDDGDETPTSTASPPAATATPEATAPGLPTSTATDDITLSGPPPANAEAGGTTERVGIGTYCWTVAGGGPGICADAIGIITSIGTLPVGAEEIVTLTIEADPAGSEAPLPTSAVASAFPATEEPLSVGAAALGWQPVEEGIALDVTVSGATLTFAAELEPGRYVVAVGTLFPEGDVQYGLVIEVR